MQGSDVPTLQTCPCRSAGGVFLHHRKHDMTTLIVWAYDSCVVICKTYFLPLAQCVLDYSGMEIHLIVMCLFPLRSSVSVDQMTNLPL